MAPTRNESDAQNNQEPQPQPQPQDQGQGCYGCGTTTGGCTDPNRHGLM